MNKMKKKKNMQKVHGLDLIPAGHAAELQRFYGLHVLRQVNLLALSTSIQHTEQGGKKKNTRNRSCLRTSEMMILPYVELE